MHEIPFNKQQTLPRNLYELFILGTDLRKYDLSAYWSPDTKIPLLLSKTTPFVVTVHDLAIFKKPDTYQQSRAMYWRKLFRLAVERSACTIAISQQTKNDIVELMNVSPDKIRVIYNGVESRFQPIADINYLAQIANKYRLPDKFLLFVGTFSPRKNISGILRSFSVLKKRFRLPHRLVMVGEKGWLYRSDLEFVNSLGLEQDVIFPGYVADEDLPGVYNLADVLLFPSLYEGFGLPVLEAMACGTPVVTSNMSALPEVAGPAGLLVDPYDQEEIASGAYRLLSDKALSSELIRAGLDWSKNFSWDKTAREMLTVFQMANL